VDGSANLNPRNSQTSIPGAGVTNAEHLGLEMFRGHPLGLELAGVILLVAVVGAVVISRQKVEQEEQM
jgi:NADH:ubiquinone oxidoreductase subunit 6 (subunit J)